MYCSTFRQTVFQNLFKVCDNRKRNETLCGEYITYATYTHIDIGVCDIFLVALETFWPYRNHFRRWHSFSKHYMTSHARHCYQITGNWTFFQKLVRANNNETSKGPINHPWENLLITGGWPPVPQRANNAFILSWRHHKNHLAISGRPCVVGRSL